MGVKRNKAMKQFIKTLFIVIGIVAFVSIFCVCSFFYWESIVTDYSVQ